MPKSESNRTYKTKHFTVTVEPHPDRDWNKNLSKFIWVRIYANQKHISYNSGSPLLLGCESGSFPAKELLKKAKLYAKEELFRMQELAKQLLELKI